MIARTEVLSGLQQSREGGQEFAVRDVTTDLSPQPCNRREPRAVGGEGPSHQPPSRRTDHGVDCITSRGVGIIPGAIDCPGRMCVDQDLPQLGDLPTPCAAPEQPHGFTRRVIDGAQALPVIRLPGGGKHHVLAWWAPHRA